MLPPPPGIFAPHATQVNYFDMDTICDVKAPSWSGEDVAPMAGFLRGYADFVLRRATQFDPAFGELMVRDWEIDKGSRDRHLFVATRIAYDAL